MKRKLVIRLIACSIVGAMLISGNAFATETAALLLPVAGSARVLGEGVRVASVATVVESSDDEAVEVVEDVASEVPVEEATDTKSNDTAEDSGDEKEATKETQDKETESKEESSKKSDSKSSDALPTAGAGSDVTSSNSAKDDDDNNDKSSSEKSSSNKKKKTTVSADTAESISAGAGTAIETSDDDGDMNLVDAVTTNPNEEDEDLSDLVIAKVNDYVYVRSEASEDSEYVGKLYNHSVGNQLSVEGDWIKIKSGTTEGYVKKEYVVTGDEAEALAKEVGTRTAKVLTTTLYVRTEASTDSDIIGMVPMDDQLTVTSETEGWAKVSVEEGEGYVSTEFVKLYTDFVHAESKAEEEARLEREEREREAARKAAEAAEAAERKAREKEAAKKNASKGSKGSKGNAGGKSSGGSSGGSGYSASGSGSGSAVANYALQFVGNPYVYGGTSLTNGADCSGFVMSVYRKFGISLPHSSGGDRGVGSAVAGGLANAQAGDIVCYSGHVAIYIGGGQIVHASTAKTGIKVSNANYRTPVAVRRIF